MVKPNSRKGVHSNVKKVLAILLALMTALTLMPAVSMAEAPDNTLKLFLIDDPETLDGQLTTDSYTIPLNCFDRLVECDTNEAGEAELVPGLAKSWEVSDDGLVYTYKLRDDAYCEQLVARYIDLTERRAKARKSRGRKCDTCGHRSECFSLNP